MDNKAITKRNTDYSMTQKLLKNIGKNRVQELWVKYGMYKSSEILSVEIQEFVSPSTLRYLSNLYDWKRNCNPESPMYKGVVINKTIPAAYYKHLIFPEENKNEENILSNDVN